MQVDPIGTGKNQKLIRAYETTYKCLGVPVYILEYF